MVELSERVAGVRGTLSVIGRRHGVAVADFTEPNLIVAGARDVLARLLGLGQASDPIQKVGIGRNGLQAQVTDVALQEPVYAVVGAPTFPSPGVVVFPYSFPENVADGMAVWEFGLVTAGGQLFARRVRQQPIVKHQLEIVGTWTIYF